MEKKRVIIVGAGIAGLTLARELLPVFDVLILEAQDRAGGRIHSVEVNGVVVERGAEFVHGRLPATLELAREAGSTVLPVTGKMYRRENERLVEEVEMTPHWDRLMNNMENQQQDLTLTAFLQEHFGGTGYDELRQQAIAFAGGFDLADPDQASVKALYREWSEDQEQNFRIREGYGSLVRFLQGEVEMNGGRLNYNEAVTAIEPDHDSFKVFTRDGTMYPSDAVVVTVPVGAIRADTIRFAGLLQEQAALVKDIGMGSVIRFVFGFRKPLWPADTGFLFSDEPVPTWWTGLQDGVHQLAGWAGGPKATALAGRPDDELIALALTSLSKILSISEEKISSELVFREVADWSVNEWSRGGYSYATTGTTAARGRLNESSGTRCWFAGEGYANAGHPGTVEAAIVHAKKIAGNIRLGYYA